MCDQIFNAYVSNICDNSNVIHIITTTNIVNDLNVCLSKIEVVKKGVKSYLEVIRLNCPRLYFISNEELVELVAKKGNLKNQTFLSKIFPGIFTVKHDDVGNIVAFVSHFHEKVFLKTPIEPASNKNINDILNDLELAMIDTIKHKTSECYKIFKKSKILDLIKKYPQQSLQLMAQVFWTDQVEHALKLSHNIKILIYKRKLEMNIEEKTKHVNDSQLTNLERIMIKDLLLTDLNNKYLLSTFLKDGLVIDDNHFYWQVQLRYYFEKSLCTVKMLQNSIGYGYEYLTNNLQMILTPLTDRCYRTILNAYFLNFFGLVRGESDTGKSQTIKSLAEALGILNFFFSCSSNLSNKILVQLIKGTVLCGCWLSLENFDQLKPEIYSVISQKLLKILDAKKLTLSNVLLNGVSIKLNPRCFISAITNFEKKSSFPENLKVLFRTFTLCEPDYGILFETSLRSKGVHHAKNLARKVVACLGLLKNVLSFQQHYCFSLRKLMNVLTVFEEKRTQFLDENNEVLLCQSLRIVFKSSLVEFDDKTFEDILIDVFQASAYKSKEKKIQKTDDIIKNVCDNMNLHLNKYFVQKVCELYEILKHRPGVLLVGDSFTGKTTQLKVCAKVFKQEENCDIKAHIINPSCLTYTDIIGKLTDDEKSEWKDGVLLKILRNCCKETSSRTWMVFDGHIDKSKTENLQNILESGQMFLESGEIFFIPENTSFIFEVTELTDASPSLVSRCGIIYIPNETTSWLSLVESWLKTCKSEWLPGHESQILSFFQWFIPPCLDALKLLNLKKHCELNDNALVKNTLTYFQLILDDARSKISRRDEDPKNLPTWIHATFLQAGLYGFGSILNCSSRQKFDEFYKILWKGQHKDHPYPEGVERLEVGIPNDLTLFDYAYLFKQRGTWKLWSDLLKSEKIMESLYLTSFLVPTTDTMRISYLLNLHIKYERKLLILGSESTGKSTILQDHFVNKLRENSFDKAVIGFNGRMTSQTLQSLITLKLNKRKGGCYSPCQNKRFILFLDDLHLSLENQNDLSSFALLRQQFDHNIWYDLNSFDKIFFERMTVIGFTGIPKEKGFPQSFLRHFNICGIAQLSDDTISRIFSQTLLHSWKKNGFPSDILTAITQIVTATLGIYTSVRKILKPTLTKCHYMFDLCSYSKVIKACTFLKKESYDANKKIYLKLWVHEMMRVFGDRFDNADLQWLMKQLKEAIPQHFGEDFDEIFPNTDMSFLNLFFGTLHEKNHHTILGHYEEINFQYIKDLCLQLLNDWNQVKKINLNLIFFDYALEMLARLFRILAMPTTNALLLGLAGCGRQSLTKLSSFIFKHELHQPIITQNYDIFSWNRDFKEVLKRCGGMNKQCVFLADEDQIGSENFFDIIDHYLRDGEITDLYNLDEKQDILELSRLAAQGGNKNLDISSHRVFMYFNKRCRENLHLIICLNSNNDLLRQRILKYPSLVTRFTVILWKDWPDESLVSVAKAWTKDLQLDEDIKSKTINAAIHFHRTCQNLPELKNFITPKSYIHLIELFTDLIISKQKMLTTKKERFLQGLSKLSFASTQIFNMQKALGDYQPQLEAMTKNAIEMTEQIALETIEVERASALVRKDEKIASEQATVAQVLKSECEAELAQAIPILEDAISALNTLKPSDITLVKSMKNPPDAIKLVMASVCVIKDVRPDRIPDPSTGRKTIDYWGPSKRILGDMNFLQTLKDFDKDHIKPEVMVKIRKEYLPHKDFKPHVVAKASSAAEGLCKWIIAMDMYDRVAKEVAPKKEKLNKAEKEYAETMRVLNEKKEEVVRIEEKLANLNVLLEEAVKKQTNLQKEVDICNKKLNSAQKLIGGLSGEKLHWTEAAEHLQKHYNLLAGDILLSSAVVAYLPSLNNCVRSQVIENWCEFINENNIPSTKPFNFSLVLSNEQEIELWREYGLPSDIFFVENAVIYNHSKQFSLFLDPQGEAAKWIQKTKDGTNLVLTKFTYKNWLTKLEFCVKNGKSILIKDGKGDIPSCLNQLLYGQTILNGNDTLVTLNGKNLIIHKNFRLYIVCTHLNPSYSFEIKSRLTLINFCITKFSLQEDLLKIVVEIEKPVIKKLTKELIEKNRENKAELKELEIKILNTLCESEADILEDEESILILDKSKELAVVVREKQDETKQIEKTINDFKQGYINVARYVTDLFFSISKLQQLHNLYQFSVEWFKNLYFTSILNAGKSKVLETRCKNLRETVTFDLFKSITKGLFEKDKLLFTFWLGTGVALSNGDISEDELLIFLGAEKYFELGEEFGKPSWVSGIVWENIQKLAALESFKGISKSFIDGPELWNTFIDQSSIDIPRPWDKLNDFRKLMLIKILKPEKLYYGIIDFITSSLGDKFLAPSFSNIKDTYNETYSLCPVLFIVTPGTDILKILYNFAAVKNMLHKFRHLSLGNQNFEQADLLIKDGQKNGCWVLLQNCQMAEAWLNELEQNLESFDFENTHENFRLFLTFEPTCEIPLDLLQNSIKILDEPPNILRKNLLKIYNKTPLISDDFFYGCPGKQDTFSKILYSMCHFHFLLQERQKVVNWNMPYRFEECDLIVSLKQLRRFVNEDNCLFEKVEFLIGQCSYCGYLKNDWEKTFLMNVLRDCLTPNIFKKGGYMFGSDKRYGLPSKNDRQDYLKHIFNLPTQDEPEVLYLTEYELLRNKSLKTQKFLNSALDMFQNKRECLLIKSEFKILSIVDDILKVVPNELKASSFGGTEPHIVQEIRLYQRLLLVVITSLKSLRRALGGDVPLSETLEELANELFFHKVPKMWLQFCYPTQHGVSKFVKGLCERVKFFGDFKDGQKTFWLGAFFFPRTVLSSVQIKFSRENKTAVENVILDYEIIVNPINVSPENIIIQNLFLLSARFDTAQNHLADLVPKTYFDTLPPLLIKPVKITSSKNDFNQDRYKCCLFKTEILESHVEGFDFLTGCENFVTEVLLNTDKKSSYWVRKGVCIVCEIAS